MSYKGFAYIGIALLFIGLMTIHPGLFLVGIGSLLLLLSYIKYENEENKS